MSKNGRSTNVTIQSSMTEEEFEQLREAFWEGRFEALLSEHEGSTQTLLFEVPSGHIGLSVCVASGEGDIFLSVDEWTKERHHEVDDRWVWVRSQETISE